MKVRALAIATLLCLFVNLVAIAAQPAKPRTRSHSVGALSRARRLATLLPATDGVALFDAKRFMSDGLPRLLEANQSLLGKIMAHVDEIQTKTGIDLRKFDEVALGLTIKTVGKKLDVDGVAIASGDINAGGLIAVAKLASNGTYREEKIAGRTVYVFTVKDVANKAAATTASTGTANLLDKATKEITSAIAVAAYDQNSLVIGSEALVKETLLGSSHPSVSLMNLLARNSSAIMNFAVKTPTGLDGMLPLGNDELGKNLRAIQYLSGSVDVTANGGSLNVAARTALPDQAQGLKDTLDGLQIMGGAFLGGSKSADKQVYARLIKSAKFGITGSEVTLELFVPQADIDTLVAGIK